MKFLRLYLEQKHILRQARAWVRANDERVVAQAMWHLNRMVRAYTPLQKSIYDLKNRLVQVFYEQGRCISATCHLQRLECWSCDGTGDYWAPGSGEGDCWKCDGTGTCRSHNLIRFVFDICGRRYVWHQPERLVTWPVSLTEADGGTYRPGNTFKPLGRDLAWVYLAAVYEYLLMVGVPASDLPRPRTLVQSIQMDWRASRMRYYVQKIKRRLSRWHPEEIPF